MLCALIMAGGKGTRFWPLSTEDKPKQFLNLIGEETMIQMTINRIKTIIPMERIFVCTSESYLDLVIEQIPSLPKRNIIVEPEGRNTAPCIALSAFMIKRYFPQGKMLVLPSDHLINNNDEFISIIKSANEFLNEKDEAIITLGMEPDRAETGYGYIKKGEVQSIINGKEICNVKSFVEKPNKKTAEKYLLSNEYFWNGGMFLWKIDNIIDKIRKFMPRTFNELSSLMSIDENEIQAYLDIHYKNTEVISIDYGVLEKADNIFVIPSRIGWDDVGSWQAIERYCERDEEENIHKGDVKSICTENNIVIADKSTVIVDGISDIYIIENDGKIFVGKKENLPNIKELQNVLIKD